MMPKQSNKEPSGANETDQEKKQISKNKKPPGFKMPSKSIGKGTAKSTTKSTPKTEEDKMLEILAQEEGEVQAKSFYEIDTRLEVLLKRVNALEASLNDLECSFEPKKTDVDKNQKAQKAEVEITSKDSTTKTDLDEYNKIVEYEGMQELKDLKSQWMAKDFNIIDDENDEATDNTEAKDKVDLKALEAKLFNTDFKKFVDFEQEDVEDAAKKKAVVKLENSSSEDLSEPDSMDLNTSVYNDIDNISFDDDDDVTGFEDLDNIDIDLVENFSMSDLKAELETFRAGKEKEFGTDVLKEDKDFDTAQVEAAKAALADKENLKSELAEDKDIDIKVFKELKDIDISKIKARIAALDAEQALDMQSEALKMAKNLDMEADFEIETEKDVGYVAFEESKLEKTQD